MNVNDSLLAIILYVGNYIKFVYFGASKTRNKSKHAKIGILR